MTLITIEVQQGLEDRFMAELPHLLSRIKHDAEYDDLMRRIANDDQAMLDYLDQRCMGAKNKQFPPIVRASTYGNKIREGQEIKGMWSLGARRPVLMRGSIDAMKGLYERKGAIAEVLAERFLRRIKFTALTHEPVNNMNEWLCRRLGQNGWTVRGSLFAYRYPGLRSDYGDAGIWRGGEWISIPTEEYEKLLREAKSKEAARVAREAQEIRAKKKWQKLMQSQDEARRDLQEKQAAEQRQRMEERRKRRAAEIAAYELLSEIGAVQ